MCRLGLRVPTGTAGVLVSQVRRAWPQDEPEAGTLVASPTTTEQHHRTASEMFNWHSPPPSLQAGRAREPPAHQPAEPVCSLAPEREGLEPDS